MLCKFPVSCCGIRIIPKAWGESRLPAITPKPNGERRLKAVFHQSSLTQNLDTIYRNQRGSLGIVAFISFFTAAKSNSEPYMMSVYIPCQNSPTVCFCTTLNRCLRNLSSATTFHTRLGRYDLWDLFDVFHSLADPSVPLQKNARTYIY